MDSVTTHVIWRQRVDIWIEWSFEQMIFLSSLIQSSLGFFWWPFRSSSDNLSWRIETSLHLLSLCCHCHLHSLVPHHTGLGPVYGSDLLERLHQLKLLLWLHPWFLSANLCLLPVGVSLWWMRKTKGIFRRSLQEGSHRKKLSLREKFTPCLLTHLLIGLLESYQNKSCDVTHF